MLWRHSISFIKIQVLDLELNAISMTVIEYSIYFYITTSSRNLIEISYEVKSVVNPYPTRNF